MSIFVGLATKLSREANENNIYFRCVQEPNEVVLLDGRRPYGPSVPRGAHWFDYAAPKKILIFRA